MRRAFTQVRLARYSQEGGLSPRSKAGVRASNLDLLKRSGGRLDRSLNKSRYWYNPCQLCITDPSPLCIYIPSSLNSCFSSRLSSIDGNLLSNSYTRVLRCDISGLLNAGLSQRRGDVWITPIRWITGEYSEGNLFSRNRIQVRIRVGVCPGAERRGRWEESLLF